MDIKSQFAGRYKTDMSIDNLRVKVARRKSITQKENRHKEFRKSRGLTLIDANVSVVKETALTVLEEVNESLFSKGPTTKTAFPVKSADHDVRRRAMLQRFLEEKQLRKMKEQREKATKGVFRCGLYKPEHSLIPVLTSQPATKPKPKEKPAPPAVTRVTRSAKTEAPVVNTRSRLAQVSVLGKVSDSTIPKGRGQTSVLKKNEKENKVTSIPPARTTRATVVTSRLATAKGSINTTSAIPSGRTTRTTASTSAASKPTTKGAAQTTAAAKFQKRTKINTEQEMALPKHLQPSVLDKEKIENPKPELTIAITAVESEIPVETKTAPREERKPSFAPENFVFQPMDGLSAFKFQPMTPKRANAFLTPTFSWSPIDGNGKFVFSRKHGTDANGIHQVSPPDLTMEATVEIDTFASPEAKKSLHPCDQDVCSSKNPAQMEETHDVLYFRGLLKSESQRLGLLCSEWNDRIDQDIPEEAKDLIRTTVGQTRLLMTERFKQFEGLVDNCEFKLGEKETTCTDLDGFWDMVYFQIEDVTKKFVNLGKMEENSWKQTSFPAKKVVRKKAVPTATMIKSQGDNGRAAARSRLAAIKAAMRNKVKQEELVEEAKVPEQPIPVNPVVFDAGFFRIESPAKIPGVRARSYSRTSNTPSAKNVLQNSENSVKGNTEDRVSGHVCDLHPSPAKSPVIKALFDTQKESFQNHQEQLLVTNLENPGTPNPDNTESESVPQVVDWNRYLVHTKPVTESIVDSPAVIEVEFSRLETRGTELEEDTTFEVTSTVVDDVFMCSPEKETKISPKDGENKILPDEELPNSKNPLDFLDGCTSNMVMHTPLKSKSDVAVSDLIVFSPMEM